MRNVVMLFGYVIALVGAIGLAIEVHGRITGDSRSNISGIVLSLVLLSAGAFIVFAMNAGFQLRWSGALALLLLVFAGSCWGDEIQNALNGEPFELRPFLIMSILPTVIASVLAWYAFRAE